MEIAGIKKKIKEIRGGGEDDMWGHPVILTSVTKRGVLNRGCGDRTRVSPMQTSSVVGF